MTDTRHAPGPATTFFSFALSVTLSMTSFSAHCVDKVLRHSPKICLGLMTRCWQSPPEESAWRAQVGNEDNYYRGKSTRKRAEGVLRVIDY